MSRENTDVTLSVIIPLFNEVDKVAEVLNRVSAVPISKQIIVVDDCSKDGTRALLQNEIEGKYGELKVIYQESNGGKATCIRRAIPSAIGKYTIIQDGDLEYDPADYTKIVQLLESSNAEAVYGSRFLKEWPPMKLPNKIVNKLLAFMVRVLYNAPITDEATCYKAFQTKFLKELPLQSKRFEFCPEVTAKTLRSGGKILETPIWYEARTISQGKKIRWTDGVEAIWTLVRYRFWKPRK